MGVRQDSCLSLGTCLGPAPSVVLSLGQSRHKGLDSGLGLRLFLVLVSKCYGFKSQSGAGVNSALGSD